MSDPDPSSTPPARADPPASAALPWLTAALLLLTVVAIVALWVSWAPMREMVSLPEYDRSYDSSVMAEAMSVANVERSHTEILDQGDRFLGLPGYFATRQLMKDRFESAGLEVVEQHYHVPAPVTAYREIFLIDEATGEETPLGIELLPAEPNSFQPVVTPGDGITGVLTVMTEEAIASTTDFSDKIAIVDAAPNRYALQFLFSWYRYADLGCPGMIVTHSDGLDELNFEWVVNRWGMGLVGGVPVNYPRFLAPADLLQYEGRRVRIRARVDYRNIPAANVIGVLRTKQPTEEALIIFSHYDGLSSFPDASKGPLQAISTAFQLQLLEGLASYRETLRRDIIFIGLGGHYTGASGLNALMQVLQLNRNRGVNPEDRSQEQWIVDRMEKNDEAAATISRILAVADDPGFLSDVDTTRRIRDGLDRGGRRFLEEQIGYVLDTFVFRHSEVVLQKKIELERQGGRIDTPAYRAYQEERRRYETLSSVSNYSILNLLRELPRFAQDLALRDAIIERFRTLAEHHATRRAELVSYRRVFDLFRTYRNIGFFEFNLAPASNEEERPEALSYTTHQFTSRGMDAAYTSILSSARSRAGIPESAIKIPPYDTWHTDLVGGQVGNVNNRANQNLIKQLGYPSFRFVNFGRRVAFRDYVSPTDEPWMRDLSSLENTFRVLGETFAGLAHGAGVLQAGMVSPNRVMDYGGRVLASNVGMSSVPDYPIAGALVGPMQRNRSRDSIWNGFSRFYYTFTDPYGRFDLPRTTADFPNFSRVGSEGQSITPFAFYHGDDGLIAWTKDEGEEGQRLYRSIRLDRRDKAAIENMTIVTFRSSPVSIFDMTNPQTLRNFEGVRFIRQDGLARFRKRLAFSSPNFETIYLEPEYRFFVEFLSGAADNELVRTTRAFMLGVDQPYPEGLTEREISGPGYLVADHPTLRNIPTEIARSMARVNEKRLRLQQRYDMADARINEYQAKSLSLLEESTRKDLALTDARVVARDAVTYSQQNHPVLRESISQAVIGIVWYLGLLVPFIFFAEKLIFAFNDIRRQIAAQSVIFLLVFVALRLLHPAFLMVRSSLMILLGFIIVMISWGITFLFYGKFQENFEELRRKQGKVSQAEVDKTGVLITAFMLGLNNMNRRKVRTGLTCATLVLLTFVLICFTSTGDDLVEENIALGKAPYQGMLIRKESFQGLGGSQINAIRAKYGDRFDVATRRMFLGRENWQERLRLNPSLSIEHNDRGTVRQRDFGSLLQLEETEPLRHHIRFLTEYWWWTEEDGQYPDEPKPCVIADTIADELGISVDAVNRGPVPVAINGGNFAVRGIFDSDHFTGLRDIDGFDMLPFDIEALEAAETIGGQVLAPPDAPRIPASELVITVRRDLGITIPNGGLRDVSVAVVMADTGYREARDVVTQFMEQTGEPLYYGLDGIAFQGQRTRSAGFGFGIDLIIPLLVGAMTVLNTMRGSVYERRDEIYIYNSVGIAPRYIFFMFIAEALVYVVIGCVLGFILSQGIGRFLAFIGLTGGMQMDFTSISTIYVSLAIAAAVILSTIFPARTAMEIASPAEESGWEIPEPEGDRLSFDLPFNFRHRGRVAVLAFFHRYLTDHGEGSSGRFFASPPEISVERTGETGSVPRIHSTIWLKPYDQGVSERLIIETPPDPETGLFKARVTIERLSGTRQAWIRLNRKFLVLIRKHFLHWRAVPEEERDVMFEEARDLLAALQERIEENSLRNPPAMRSPPERA